MRVRVLVERALAGARADLLGRAGVREQVAVRRRRLVRVRDDDELTARLEPRFDPLDRVRDDRGAGHRELA